MPKWAPSEPQLVRLSPDGRRVAFACYDGGAMTLWVSAAVAREAAEPWDLHEVDGGRVPSDSERALMLVECREGPLVDVAWSSDGSHLAYRVGGFPPGYGETIGWVHSTEAGRLGRTAGIAFAWAPNRPALYVADVDEYAIRRIPIDGAPARSLAEFVYFRDPAFWPRIVPSPDGTRVAFTTRNDPEDVCRLWTIEPQAGQPAARLVTMVPGADAHLLPLWSPKGVSLGLHVVHVALRTTGFVVLRALRGEGEIFYQHEAVDGPVTPAWRPDGRALALYRHDADASPVPSGTGSPATELDPGLELSVDTTAGPDPLDPNSFPKGSPGQPLPDQTLGLLDLSTGAVQPLAATGELSGELRFLDQDHLLVDGGACAHLLRLERKDDKGSVGQR